MNPDTKQIGYDLGCYIVWRCSKEDLFFDTLEQIDAYADRVGTRCILNGRYILDMFFPNLVGRVRHRE